MPRAASLRMQEQPGGEEENSGIRQLLGVRVRFHPVGSDASRKLIFFLQSLSWHEHSRHTDSALETAENIWATSPFVSRLACINSDSDVCYLVMGDHSAGWKANHQQVGHPCAADQASYLGAPHLGCCVWCCCCRYARCNASYAYYYVLAKDEFTAQLVGCKREGAPAPEPLDGLQRCSEREIGCPQETTMRSGTVRHSASGAQTLRRLLCAWCWPVRC